MESQQALSRTALASHAPGFIIADDELRCRVRRVLLTESDLPAGWTRSTLTAQREAGGDIERSPPPVCEALVTFAGGFRGGLVADFFKTDATTNRVEGVEEVVAVFDAGRGADFVTQAMGSCHLGNFPDQNAARSLLEMPSVGDQTIGFQGHVGDYSEDDVIVRRGDVIEYFKVGVGNLPAIDPALVALIVQTADAKVAPEANQLQPGAIPATPGPAAGARTGGAAASAAAPAPTRLATIPTLAPEPTQDCAPKDLSAKGSYGKTQDDIRFGYVEAVVELTLNAGSGPCLISSDASFTLRDARGQPIEALVTFVEPTDYRLILQSDGFGDPGGTIAIFRWANWCAGARNGPLTAVVRLSAPATEFDAELSQSTSPDGTIIAPPCVNASAPSTLAFQSSFSGQLPTAGLSPCNARDIIVEADGYASLSAADLFASYPGIEGSMRFKRETRPACTVGEWDKLELYDALGNKLDVQVETPVDVSRAPGELTVLYGPSNGYEKFVWTNWCGGARPGPLHIVITLPGDLGAIDWPAVGSTASDGTMVTPPCSSGRDPSSFSVPRTF